MRGPGHEQGDGRVVPAAGLRRAAGRRRPELLVDPADASLVEDVAEVGADPGGPRRVGLGVAEAVRGQAHQPHRGDAQVDDRDAKRGQRVGLAQAGGVHPVEEGIVRDRRGGVAVIGDGEDIPVTDLGQHQPRLGYGRDQEGGAVGHDGVSSGGRQSGPLTVGETGGEQFRGGDRVAAHVGDDRIAPASHQIG